MYLRVNVIFKNVNDYMQKTRLSKSSTDMGVRRGADGPSQGDAGQAWREAPTICWKAKDRGTPPTRST